MMKRLRWCGVLAAVVQTLTGGVRLDARQERDAGGFKAPTAALERGRAVYVLNHCHFCHGVDLTQATMGAANLSQSPFVGADEDGNMIGPLVKAGLPNLQTAMPSYSELTSDEIVDLARYVHFLRQQARFRELSRLADTPAGDRTAGEAYFNGEANCRSCHSVTGDLAGIGGKYDAATLRSRLLRPGPAMPSDGVHPTAGQAAHLRLLENYTAANVRDLIAYLGATRGGPVVPRRSRPPA
jgi:mono/diheme cytochrome c family protein